MMISVWNGSDHLFTNTKPNQTVQTLNETNIPKKPVQHKSNKIKATLTVLEVSTADVPKRQ